MSIRLEQGLHSPSVRDLERDLRLGQLRVLEMIANGEPLASTLAAVCELIESQEAGLLCSILLLDAQGRHTGSGIGPSLPQEFLDALAGICIDPPYVGSCCHALDTGVEIVVADVEHDLRWAAAWRETNLRHGLRACRSIPVFGDDGSVLASAAVFRTHAGDPGPQDRTLLHIATSLAGIAIQRDAAESQRRALSTAVEDANRRTALLLEAASGLLSAREPQTMLHSVFTDIAPALQLSLFLHYRVADNGDGLVLASSSGVPPEVCSRVERLHFDDGRDADFSAHFASPDFPREFAERHKGFLRGFAASAQATLPLVGGDGLLGIVSFGSRERDEFGPEDIDFLASICKYAAAAYERLSLIAKLRDADQRKNEFLATLSHELRNPLAPLRNGIELLKVGRGNPEVGEKATALIERQLRLMTRLVDDLMDVSRIAGGRLEIRHDVFDLASACQQAVELSVPVLQQGRHLLDVELPDGAVLVDGDCDRMVQVVANLLNNAARYTPSDGRIGIRLACDGQQAVIEVRDSGIGIPVHLLDEVFSMFAQVDPHSTRSRQGMGIGLALCKGLVEAHGGTVAADSPGAGKGATFTVRVPLSSRAREILGRGEEPSFDFRVRGT